MARSTPRSLASLRTGGFASARTAPGSAASAVRAEVAGTTGSSASSTSSERAPPGAKAPCSWIWALAPASDAGAAPPRRARRIGPRSALLRPTRLSPSPPPLAAGLERSISISAASSPGVFASGAAAGAAPSPIVMIGVPTGTISPSGTISFWTVPAYGEGSSTRDFAVSISTMMSLISTVSPSLTFQETISASVRPSPTSGSLNSAIRTQDSCPRRRGPGRGRGGSPPRSATRGRGCRSRRRGAPAPPGSRSTPR